MKELRGEIEYIEYLLELSTRLDIYDEWGSSYDEDSFDIIVDSYWQSGDYAFCIISDHNIDNVEDLEELLDFFFTYELEFNLTNDYKKFRKKIIKDYNSLQLREEELCQLHNNCEFEGMAIYNKLVKRPTISFLRKLYEFFGNIDWLYKLRYSICKDIINWEKQKEENIIQKRKIRKWRKSLKELLSRNSNQVKKTFFDKLIIDLENEEECINDIEFKATVIEIFLETRDKAFFAENIDSVATLDCDIKNLKNEMLELQDEINKNFK